MDVPFGGIRAASTMAEDRMNGVIVIGYGNTFRRDDGVGARAAEAIEELNLAGVQTRVCHQLTPELAEVISHAQAVVFVDALANHTAEVAMEEVSASTGRQISPHSVHPSSLVEMAGQLYGRKPAAWTVGIPTEDFSFGEGLSPRAEAGLHRAVEMVRAWVESRK